MAGVRSQRRRLAAMEAKLLPRPKVEPQGAYETHYTNAWPACNDIPGVKARQCSEHGPSCAVTVTPVHASIRRVTVLEGAPAGPWMALG